MRSAGSYSRVIRVQEPVLEPEDSGQRIQLQDLALHCDVGRNYVIAYV